MIDREKLMAGLEHYVTRDNCTEDCPYWDTTCPSLTCPIQMSRDILAALREDADEIERLKARPTVESRVCGTCRHGIAMEYGYVACNKPYAGIGNSHKSDWYCADWC